MRKLRNGEVKQPFQEEGEEADMGPGSIAPDKICHSLYTTHKYLYQKLRTHNVFT